MHAVPIAKAERTAGCEPLRRVCTERFCIVERFHDARSLLHAHFHETANVSFVVRGSFAERNGRQVRDCEPYDVLVTPAGHVHTLAYGARGARSLSVEFLPAAIGSASAVLQRPLHIAQSIAAPMASRIRREAASLDDLSDLAIEALLLELLVESGRRVKESETAVPQWLRNVTELLRSSLHRSFTIAEIARVADVHPAHLTRAFRRFYRCTPAEYLRALRVEFARRELNGSAPLVEIAARAGFSSQSHFSTAFRRATGLTPLAYRRNEKMRER